MHEIVWDYSFRLSERKQLKALPYFAKTHADFYKIKEILLAKKAADAAEASAAE